MKEFIRKLITFFNCGKNFSFGTFFDLPLDLINLLRLIKRSYLTFSIIILFIDIMKILSVTALATFLGCRAQLNEFRFKENSWVAPKDQEGYYAFVGIKTRDEAIDLEYVILDDCLKNKCALVEKKNTTDEASVKEHFRN